MEKSGTGPMAWGLSAAAQNRGFNGEDIRRMKNCTTRDDECVLRIAGVTGSPTGGGRTVGGGAEMLNIAADTADAAEYSYFNMMH
jgi:hypothetical protein